MSAKKPRASTTRSATNGKPQRLEGDRPRAEIAETRGSRPARSTPMTRQAQVPHELWWQLWRYMSPGSCSRRIRSSASSTVAPSSARTRNDSKRAGSIAPGFQRRILMSMVRSGINHSV